MPNPGEIMMQTSEKRARLMQGLEMRLKESAAGKNSGAGGRIQARAAPAPAENREDAVKENRARTVPYSEVGSIKSIITSPPAADKKAEEIFACINRLEERIDMLEAQMKRHFGNSKLVETEINRLVADRWESLSRETDECLTRMMGEMQDLRDIVIGLRSSVRGMEK